jgi:hypothetical protein
MLKRLALCLLLLAGGCLALPAASTQPFTIGELRLEEDFNDPLAWEAYADPALGVDLRVEDSRYHIRATSGGLMWGLNAHMHTDVVISVQTEQLSDDVDNGYGVMCRVDPAADGDGYYFLISGNGYFSIRRGVGRVIEPLIAWTQSDAIQQARGRNRLRAVCVEDYLALYVNGTFVGKARDDLYLRGVTGLVAGMEGEGSAEITFDDVRLWDARLWE